MNDKHLPIRHLYLNQEYICNATLVVTTLGSLYAQAFSTWAATTEINSE
jgi:hypothetical protein